MIGLYNYAIAKGIDLFDELSLPAELDKDTLVNNILLKCGDFECMYPSVDFLHPAITLWCRKWERTIVKWNDALQIKYEPLNNYDRTEEYTDVFSNKGTSSSGGGSTSTSTGSVTNKVSAYDSDTLTDKDKSDNAGSSVVSSNSTNNSDNKGETHHSARLFGNIGVTTSQQMLQSELDIAQWNIYDHITDLFLSEFIIPVY